ncbi:aromatic ring-hydroxylating oxygenase subunit alpha [Cryptosporangium phraense]|uniref:Aromatic ring-hydroxylating dioxygenase subunit alpha n=1 Tax=Cryptosporangium phraense TaxID=2593070 RepID=A0A545AX20_9ACTN|nr:aromatic ring-hydroxylating dioxygenase subunit alpha [Cryptosporangium phraense]TQS45876.1 aromatic ring-hydroxylating dioxygenase subunit alpha [Cryptosporangium phraense]
MATTAAPSSFLSNIDPALRQFWHPVALTTEVPDSGRPLRVDLLGHSWVILRLDGRLVALYDRCPHRLVPLSEGTVVGDRLQCRYHGYEFDADGRCRHVPALGTEPPPPRIRVPTAHVRPAFGLVWLCEAEIEPAFPLSESPYLDPDLDTFVAGPFETRVDAGLLTDNFLDVTHLPFLHAQTFGGVTDEVHELEVERSGWSLRQSTDSVTTERGETLPVHYDYTLHAPFACQLAMTTLAGDREGRTDYVWSFCQPQAADRTRWFLVHAYAGLDHDPAAVADAAEFQTRVGLEDLSILEPMRRPSLPLDNSECHTRGDKGCVAYRQIMKSVAAGESRPLTAAPTSHAV